MLTPEYLRAVTLKLEKRGFTEEEIEEQINELKGIKPKQRGRPVKVEEESPAEEESEVGEE